MFFKRQVFLKAVPGAKLVPSGTVTSATNWAQSQVEAAAAGVGIPAAGTSDNNIAIKSTKEKSFNLERIGILSFYILPAL